MGRLTCLQCGMTIESEGLEDDPRWVCASCGKPASGSISTSKLLITLTCKKCGTQIQSADPEESGDWTCSACLKEKRDPISTSDIPTIITPPPILIRAESAGACPACGYGMKLRKSDMSARFLCPSCHKKLCYDEDGALQLYDEFKEFLKKRPRATAQSSRAQPAVPEVEPEAESEEEAERAPAGLILAFILFPLLAAYGLSFWPDALHLAEQWARPVLKLLGIGQI